MYDNQIELILNMLQYTNEIYIPAFISNGPCESINWPPLKPEARLLKKIVIGVTWRIYR